MPLTNSQYNAIRHIYDERQLDNRYRQQKRRQEIYDKIIGFKELDASIATISVFHGKSLIAGDEEALDQLKTELEALRLQKEKLLLEAGYPADYLAPLYTCSDCQDTGYIGQQKCHCFKQEVINLLYHQTNLHNLFEQDNFDTLSYEYYTGDDLTRFQSAVEVSKSFVNGFDNEYKNILFYGTVGTGKSFLSGCIAKELISTGHSVIYFSAVDFFELLSKRMYFRNENPNDITADDLSECDLLIIDDLGTELLNQFVASNLFSYLNERFLAHKSVIISTNLSLEELRDRYSDRVFSRITSQYSLCKLTGRDIRIEKRKKDLL